MASKVQDKSDALGPLSLQEFYVRSPQAVITLDADARIVDWNPAAEQMHAQLDSQFRGQPYATLVPEALHGEFKTTLDKVRRRRTVPHRATRRLTADGTEIDVDFAMHGLWSGPGELSGFLILARDTSAQLAIEAELQRSVARTHAIVQTVVDGIVTINAQGIIDAVNPAVETMFGYRGHELIGRNVKMLMPEPYRGEHDRYLEAYLTTGRAKIIGIGREVKAIRKDGSTFPIDLSVSEMTVGNERSFVGVLHDISERKEAEKAMRRLNQRLRNKVDELAQTLERLRVAQDSLVEAEKMASLGSLVAGVAHEINTPVGVCVTASSYLAGATRSLRDQFQSGQLRQSSLTNYLKAAEESTAILESNLRRAAHLIASFKQVAVDRSSNLIRHFKLRQFLDELLTSLLPELRGKRHEVVIECADDLTVELYPGALSQVLTNLIQNALLHAFDDRTSGTIRIAAETAGGDLLIHFQDNGRGMPPNELAQIFDPFFTTRRGQGGTGLGLSVTYNLVHQALGGTITVTSKPGEGTRFELRLPLQQGESTDN